MRIKIRTKENKKGFLTITPTGKIIIIEKDNLGIRYNEIGKINNKKLSPQEYIDFCKILNELEVGQGREIMNVPKEKIRGLISYAQKNLDIDKEKRFSVREIEDKIYVIRVK